MGNISYLNDFFISEVAAYFTGTKRKDIDSSCDKLLKTIKDYSVSIQTIYVKEIDEVSVNVSFNNVCDVNILKIKDFCEAKLVARLVFKVDKNDCLHFCDKTKKIFIKSKKIIAINNRDIVFSFNKDLRDIITFEYILDGKEKLNYDLKNNEVFKRRTYSRIFADSVACILTLGNYDADACGRLDEKLKNRVTLFKFLIDVENLKIPYEEGE